MSVLNLTYGSAYGVPVLVQFLFSILPNLNNHFQLFSQTKSYRLEKYYWMQALEESQLGLESYGV